MEYDFKNAPDRSHTDSVKWDVKPGELPMWIADMDFKTAPEIIKAMKEKVSLGAFGYEWPQADYFNAVADWYEIEHGYRPQTNWMIFTTGVVPAISSIVRRVSHIGDNVLVQEPVYNIFYNSILNNGRHVLSSNLVFDGEHYSIDWTDLEEKLADPLTTLMIFCNPHNPIGKVWTKAEVQKIAQLCQKHHVVLLLDEIHGDLVRKGQGYTPAFSIEAKSNVISLVSPSKTFNVAALHAAYEEGHDWLKKLKQQLNENFDYVSQFIQENVPEVKVVSGDATYLMWINVQKVTDNSADFAAFLRKETGLIISAGSVYRGNGQDFIRINLACPLAMVKDEMKRLVEGIRKYSK